MSSFTLDEIREAAQKGSSPFHVSTLAHKVCDALINNQNTVKLRQNHFDEANNLGLDFKKTNINEGVTIYTFQIPEPCPDV